jgi:hypothetical protein
VCQFSHSSVLGLVLPKNQQRSIGIDGGRKVASKRVCLCGDHKAASRILIRQPQYGVFGSLADRLVPEVWAVPGEMHPLHAMEAVYPIAFVIVKLPDGMSMVQ